MFPSDMIGAVGAVLSDLDVDDATINRILSNLQSGSDTVGANKFKNVPSDSFGTLSGGTEMGVHTGKAHDFMADSMKEMLKTLGYYRTGVEIFRRKVKETDDVSAEDLRRYHRAVQNAEGVNAEQPPDYDPVNNGGK